MKRKSCINRLLLLLLGALTALPLLFDGLALLSFVLWAPFAYYAKRSIERPLREIYFSALLFFWGYFMAAFSFFVYMYPLDFAGLDAFSSVTVILAAVLLLPLLQSALFSPSVLLLALAGKRKLFRFPCAFSLFFASLCLVFFYLQNFTWLGVPWASPALALTSSPILIQSASLLGSFFLTFLILFVGALLAEAFDAFRACKDKAALLAAALAVILFLSNLFMGLALTHKTSHGETLKVAVLQGNSPIKNRMSDWRAKDTYKALALDASKEGADLMLWPESVFHHALETDSALQEYFSSVAKETNAIQVVGVFSFKKENDEGKLYNSLFLFYPDGEQSEVIYHKRRPVPFGEYLPMPKLFSALIPALADINMLSRDVDAGKDTNLFDTEHGRLGALICFDSIYPTLARESTNDGAELLLVATNDTWFDGSFAKNMHLSHAVLRAVENGRAVARAGNTGYSAIIDEHGVILADVPLDECSYAVQTVTLRQEKTLYTKTGDLFVYAVISFLILYPTVSTVLNALKKRKENLL